MDGRSEGPLAVDSHARRWTSKDVRRRCHEGSPINMLPDDVLLEIFDFLLLSEFRVIEEWKMLAHVCRQWRRVVFRSPLHLNLQLLCTPKTPVRDTLDIWPPLPLIIRDYYYPDNGITMTSVDNIIAALEHNDRVCQINFTRTSSPELNYVTDSAAMQRPFPELTYLQLIMRGDDESPAILPDSFLDGTVPRLRSLDLRNVSFPGLPKLLFSTTHLGCLCLYNIPRSGYIPPEAMATTLSALTNLESLDLHFRHPPPRPALENRRPPPLTRSILLSLTGFVFKGASEYLEEILAWIDAPRLHHLRIIFFNQIIFDTPQLFQCISRGPALSEPKKGHIKFSSQSICVSFSALTSELDDLETISVGISCTASDWQLSSLQQLCASSLPPVSTLEDLYITESPHWPSHWHDDIENTLWLDLLRPFVAVKNLYLSCEIVPRIAPALQELVGGRTTEVLPTLENIFSDEFLPSEPIHEGIEKFIAARRLTSHPVAVSFWFGRAYDCYTPMLKALDIACVVFEDCATRVDLSSRTSDHRELDHRFGHSRLPARSSFLFD